ncbi:S-methyl-5-thioribose kinase [Acetobacterium paludosum]|uniref:S-methyl-5-thioribose kinase n=1 Tax=Acetobacterium paludosum TaxID=52693 RepID=A0A923HTT4_9FIRM|nr:S-methyl-5-thioribose kinase [Acetobacterium paludosum]MBC3887582.1 S-methyl-5-thioribose kinase [Acetobacterium paludosum]
MSYRDLTPKTVIEYIKNYTDIFPAEAVLDVYEVGGGEDDGDGFVNHIYRVWDETGKSVILKQAKPHMRVLGEAAKLTTKRNQTEAEIIKLRTAITPEYLPKMYHVDQGNNLFVYEDCGHLKIMRFELIKGKSFPEFPKQIGEFIAKSNFYTSEIYLDQITHKALECKFMNPEMRRIMETILFSRESFLEHDIDHTLEGDPNHLAMAELFWDKREVRVELLKLRGIFMKRSECLVHGDLHTSNIMIDEKEMKVIDMEYPFMGPTSADMGYLMGNLIYEYIAWFYHPEGTPKSRKAYRKEILGYIKDMVYEYQKVYSGCWDKDAKPIYREYTEYRDDILKKQIKEVCGFAGCQIASRVGALVPLPDFDVLQNLDSRNSARRLSLLIADTLIMKHEEIETVKDIIKLIKTITHRYFDVMKALIYPMHETIN